jgi:hypothetical protein
MCPPVFRSARPIGQRETEKRFDLLEGQDHGIRIPAVQVFVERQILTRHYRGLDFRRHENRAGWPVALVHPLQEASPRPDDRPCPHAHGHCKSSGSRPPTAVRFRTSWRRAMELPLAGMVLRGSRTVNSGCLGKAHTPIKKKCERPLSTDEPVDSDAERTGATDRSCEGNTSVRASAFPCGRLS